MHRVQTSGWNCKGSLGSEIEFGTLPDYAPYLCIASLKSRPGVAVVLGIACFVSACRAPVAPVCFLFSFAFFVVVEVFLYYFDVFLFFGSRLFPFCAVPLLRSLHSSVFRGFGEGLRVEWATPFEVRLLWPRLDVWLCSAWRGSGSYFMRRWFLVSPRLLGVCARRAETKINLKRDLRRHPCERRRVIMFRNWVFCHLFESRCVSGNERKLFSSGGVRGTFKYGIYDAEVSTLCRPFT